MHIIDFNAMKALGIVQTHGKCRIRLTIAKTSNPLRLNLFFFLAKNDVKSAKTRSFALKTGCLNTGISLRLNAFFSKKDVKSAKTRYFALKTRFMHFIGFNAMKALKTCKRIELCRIRLNNAKTTISVR